MKINPAVIVGSGPAGISIARALVERNIEVLLIDTGFALEEKQKRLISEMAGLSPEDWENWQLDFLKGDAKISFDGSIEKKQFGSNFASRANPQQSTILENASVYISSAKGGLSNLWGRGIDPLAADFDSLKLPFKAENLNKYYRKVLSRIPVSSNFDNFSDIFPTFKDDVFSFKHSSQAALVLNKLNKNEGTLKENGILFGSGRLAANLKDCRYCGMCMYGCPYGLLWSSQQELDLLIERPNFNYLPGLTVKKFLSLAEHTEVIALNSENETETFLAKKVFLAAGAISTTRIVMESLNRYDEPVYLETSELCYVPVISLLGKKGVTKERLMTLTQFVFKIFDKDISKSEISIHFHGFSLLFLDYFKKLCGKWFVVLRPLVDFFLSRFFVGFVFLPSECSSKLKLAFTETKEFKVSGVGNSQTLSTYKLLKRKLFKLGLITSLIPIPFFNGRRLPGSSMHFGGSFPMANDEMLNEYNTNSLGELAQQKHTSC